MRTPLKTALLLIAACAAFTGSGAVFAHDGHGLTGSHWHASDTWGFVILGAVVALAVWFSRHDK
jgi:hypothetical protein